ncbi:MAG: NAD-binding protein [Myxococcota bacterium]
MSAQRKVRRALEHPITESVVAVLIVTSVCLVLVEAWLSPTSEYFYPLSLANDIVTIVFIVELMIRFYAERRKERFLRKCWYDILAVLPVFRGLRFLRLLRLFRVGIIATRRLRKVSAVFRVVRVEYVIIGLAILTVVLMGGLSMRFAEGAANPEFNRLDRSLWFALMTVIAGEPIGGWPTTTLGRTVTVVMMLSGLTVFAIFTGTISAIMIDTLKKVRLHGMEIDDLHDHVVICGWNQAGPLIIDELLHDPDYKHFVVVTESESVEDSPVVEQYPGQVLTLKGDYTRIDTLREAGIERAASALLLADETMEERTAQDRDARTVLAAMLIEKLNSEIYTTVQLLNRDNEASLRRVGVEEIIVSEEYVGHVMATVTKNRGIVSMLDELLTAEYGHQFYRCPIPDDLVGLTVGEAVSVLKTKYDATLLAVDAGGQPGTTDAVKVNPPGDMMLEEGFYLFIAASFPLS